MVFRHATHFFVISFLILEGISHLLKTLVLQCLKIPNSVSSLRSLMLNSFKLEMVLLFCLLGGFLNTVICDLSQRKSFSKFFKQKFQFHFS